MLLRLVHFGHAHRLRDTFRLLVESWMPEVAMRCMLFFWGMDLRRLVFIIDKLLLVQLILVENVILFVIVWVEVNKWDMMSLALFDYLWAGVLRGRGSLAHNSQTHADSSSNIGNNCEMMTLRGVMSWIGGGRILLQTLELLHAGV